MHSSLQVDFRKATMAGNGAAISQIWLLAMTLVTGEHSTGALKSVSKFIKHYEGLSYDREALHLDHQRIKRELQPHRQQLQLSFKAFQREFRLRLRRDTSAFTDDFNINSGDESQAADLMHIFSGRLEDEQDSSCHGSVRQGLFEGSITTRNGTYYVESMHRYNVNDPSHHSLVYRDEDIDDSALANDRDGFCGADRLTQRLHRVTESQEEPATRSRRGVDQSKTSCLLHLYADHLFFKRFDSVQDVVAQVAGYMRAINDIYDKADFKGINIINFRVKSLTIVKEREANNPLHETHIGPEMLLRIFSQMAWSDYCLSYLLTDRDFSGVLGLAWQGEAASSGGICSRLVKVDGKNCSQNTGLITLQNFGHYLPPKQVHLTFAHELGHSLGAPHDKFPDCENVEDTGDKGWYLMYPHATKKIQENSDKFSPCSIKHISNILNIRKDKCFTVSDRPICGNYIVEEGEECDVGLDDSDPCCFSSKEQRDIQCRLKPGKLCSPSQGLCCNSSCEHKAPGVVCEKESDCEMAATCTGSSSGCPAPGAKPNMTVCREGMQVCLNGDCALSLCAKYDLEQCDCPGESRKEMCHLCCQQLGNPDTCASTTSSILSKFFQGKRIPLVAGAPCSANQGYCDKFRICRLLDADGPIARLKNDFLHLDEFDDLAEWMKVHWWVILLAILTLAAVMAGTVLLFGRTLESSTAV